MIDFLRKVYCAVVAMAAAILDGLVWVLNLAIVGLAAAISTLLNLLPLMPDPPGAWDSDVMRTVNYFFPARELIAFFLISIAVWGVVAALSPALRFFRVIE